MTSDWQTHPWVTEGAGRIRFSAKLGLNRRAATAGWVERNGHTQ